MSYNSTQVADSIQSLKYFQYAFINDKAEKSDWIRLAAPLVALSAVVLGVALIVSSVVEPVIKGLYHIVGAPISKHCNFSVGLTHITFGLADGVLNAVLWTLFTSAEVVVAPFGVAIAPKSFAETMKHELKARQS